MFLLDAWVGCQRLPRTIPLMAYPDRWVRIDRSFQSDKDVDVLRELARTAAGHGLTGIVLSGMDGISLGMPEDLERLRKARAIADANHLEIIPEGFNTGYGGALLTSDKNLAEGLLVKDALFVVRDGTARFVADSPRASSSWGAGPIFPKDETG
jgi:hypothetical protein